MSKKHPLPVCHCGQKMKVERVAVGVVFYCPVPAHAAVLAIWSLPL